jgi:hypothetical protein
MDASPPAGDRSWYIVGRWQEYEGEARANLFRIVGVAAFYLVELANYYGLRLGVFEMPAVRPREFHHAVTALAVAWVMLALGVQLCLRNRVFPASLKFLSTGGDLLLLTGLLCVAEGPRSPAVAAYFAVLALAALRLNVPLMRAATAGAVVGYLFVLGRANWITRHDVPRYHQAIVLICLGLTGACLVHVVRRVRGMAEEYARRIASSSAAPGRRP